MNIDASAWTRRIGASSANHPGSDVSNSSARRVARVGPDDAAAHLLAEPPPDCVGHRVDELDAGRCVVPAGIAPS